MFYALIFINNHVIISMSFMLSHTRMYSLLFKNINAHILNSHLEALQILHLRNYGWQDWDVPVMKIFDIEPNRIDDNFMTLIQVYTFTLKSQFYY